MNKILNLFDENYVLNLFNREILPLYPGFKEIKQITIKPIKKNVWETTYHVVIEFLTTFSALDGRLIELPLYCSAHSSEPRKNSFAALTFLWRNGFNRGDLTISRPLFFSPDFNGFFYRGVRGNNLYYYIRHQNFPEVETIIPKIAAWFAKLHKLPGERAKNFNALNSRVATVIPGYKLIFDKLRQNYPGYRQIYQEVFEYVGSKEKKFLDGQKKHWLIHGDAHPENVIKINDRSIAIIDFTDICLADFARDLGAFLQQFEYMSSRKSTDDDYIKKIKKLFLDNYLKAAEIKLDDSLQERINYYYAWTSLRTATLFLLKESPEPERAHELLFKARRDLKFD